MSDVSNGEICLAVLMLMSVCILIGLSDITHDYLEETQKYTDDGYNRGYTEHNESVYNYYTLVVGSPNVENEEYYTAKGYIYGYNQWKLDSMKASLGV